jgi:hypothetical protein
MSGHSIVSQHFMEPEGSIPNSQELSTCSYPDSLKHVQLLTNCSIYLNLVIERLFVISL